MFGDDFFSEIERALNGTGRSASFNGNDNSRPVQKDSMSYSSNMNADYDRVEGDKAYFIIVNFYEKISKSDVSVEIQDDVSSNESDSSWLGSNEKVLSIVNQTKENSYLKIKIPKKIAKKKFTFTLNNGILEVKFV